MEGNEQVASDHSNTQTVVLSDGTSISLEEAAKGYQRQRDYTIKTTQLADERKRIQQEKEQLAAKEQAILEKASYAERLQEAVQKDLQWYRDHPNTEDWAGYQSEAAKLKSGSNKVNTETRTETTTAAAVPVTTVKLDPEDRKLLEQDAASRAKAAREAEANRVYNTYIEAQKEFKLADEDLILEKIEIFHNKNGRLPGNDEIVNLVKDVHNMFVKKGVPVPAGEATVRQLAKRGAPPPATGSMSPAGTKTAVETINPRDHSAMTELMIDSLLELAEQKGA